MNEYIYSRKNLHHDFEDKGYDVVTTGKCERLLMSIHDNPSCKVEELAYLCGFGTRTKLFVQLCLEKAIADGLITENTQEEGTFILTDTGLSLYNSNNSMSND